MIDAVKCFFLSGSITLFANVPQIFEYPVEKIGFGALLFLIIWTYMKQILPKTQEEMQRLRDENRSLTEELLNGNRRRDAAIPHTGIHETTKCDGISSREPCEADHES